METKQEYSVVQLGKFCPQKKEVQILQAGEVGFVAASIKNVDHVRIGDTLTSFENKAEEPLPGYRILTPMVFSGLYPVDSDDFSLLQDSAKLRLNFFALGYIFVILSGSAEGLFSFHKKNFFIHS